MSGALASAALVSARDATARFLAQHGKSSVDAAATALGLVDLPILPAPILLDRAARARIAASSEALTAILARALAARLATNDDVLAQHLRIPPALAPLVDVERARGDAHAPLACVRLDGLLDEATGVLRYIEVQAGDPSGPGWTDLALRAWCEAGLMDALGAEPDLLATERVRVLRARVPGSSDPRVVHALPSSSFVWSDHVCMAAVERALGLDAHVVEPSALSLEGDVLLSEAARVDLVVRDTHDEIGGDHAVAGAATLVAAHARGLPIVNAFSDAILDDKGSFALLFDAEFRVSLDAAERTLVDAFVPETHLVDDAARAMARADPRGFVLKPREGYGGFGVVVGEDDPEALRAQLDSARAETHVLQRAISQVPRAVFVKARAGIVEAPRIVAFSSWVIGGRFAGCFARAGEGRVVNVHQGGGIAPVLFV